jgi:NADPH-dependent curcumin reductase CurA
MDTRQIVLASRPKGKPTIDNFRFEDIELPNIKVGEVELAGMYYSVDPYMRGRMNETKSYVPPFQLDQPIEGAVIAKVINSLSPDLKRGDIVSGRLPWRGQMVASAVGLQKIEKTAIPLSYYLGILGMPGLAAYFGLLDIGRPVAGETLVVSGAAGAVGIVVGQIAKIYGCHVIGITGSDDKVRSLKGEFKFDEVINYKTTKDMKGEIGRLCPKGVDIYFDNVGGDISDAAISNINFHARIALCGQIALYNSSNIPVGPRLQPMLLTRSALMQGFIVGNYQARFPEGIEKLTQWVRDDKIKFTETFSYGFDKLPSALIGLFSGENTGKMIVEV